MGRRKPDANGSADVFCGVPTGQKVGWEAVHPAPILGQNKARLSGARGMWAIVLQFGRAARLQLDPGD